MALPPIAVTEVALGGISRYYNISDASIIINVNIKVSFMKKIRVRVQAQHMHEKK